MKKLIALFKSIACSLVVLAGPAQVLAATFYVDSAASGSKTGADWANAWTAFSQISGVKAGDTVSVSKGTYTVSGWKPPGGSAAGGPVTYQISREAGHAGVANFNCSGAFLSGAITYVTFTGDGGDGAQHFVLKGVGRVIEGSNSDHLHVAYVDAGHSTGSFGYFNGGTAIEVDHCSFYKDEGSSSAADNIFYFDVRGSGWSVNSIHDCVFHIPRSNSGMGDDGIQSGCGSSDIYNNDFIGYTVNYTGHQHQDGIQPLGSSYLKIYNNYFQDMANYPVFCDAYNGDFKHVRIYNNISVITSKAIQGSDPPRAYVVVPDGGAFNEMGRWPVFDDITVSNNLGVDYGTSGHAIVQLANQNSGQHSVFTNCSASNNIALASQGGFWLEDSIQAEHNMSLPDNGGNFVKYVPLTAGNDFHLLAGASSLRAQGTNLTQFFSIDKDGVMRPATGGWDIGPYQYVGSGGGPTPTPPMPTPTPAPSATPEPTPPAAAKFKVGDHVKTISVTTNIRENPSGTVLGTQSMGATGIVLDGPQIKDLRENVTWYDVDFASGADGWCGDDNLVLTPEPTPSPSPTPTPTPPQPTPTPKPPTQTFEKWIEDQNNWIRAHPPVPDQ